MTGLGIGLGGLRALPEFLTGALLYRAHRAGLLARLPVVMPALPFIAWGCLAVLPQDIFPPVDAAIALVAHPLLLALLVRGRGRRARLVHLAGRHFLSALRLPSRPDLAGLVHALVGTEPGSEPGSGLRRRAVGRRDCLGDLPVGGPGGEIPETLRVPGDKKRRWPLAIPCPNPYKPRHPMTHGWVSTGIRSSPSGAFREVTHAPDQPVKETDQWLCQNFPCASFWSPAPISATASSVGTRRWRRSSMASVMTSIFST